MRGDISLHQAHEIATAEESAPGAAKELVAVAQEQPFHVLRDKARKTKLEAEQRRDLGMRQHQARRARNHSDALGMVHIRMELEPHLGAPIVARAPRPKRSGSSARPGTRARRSLSSATAGRAREPRGGTTGLERCHRGRGVQDPGARAGLTCSGQEDRLRCVSERGFYDGTDLRRLKRWSRDIPVEVRVALKLGPGPEFDCIVCTGGNRFRTELDHVRPRSAGGPTSSDNLRPRCYRCHQRKTARDRGPGALGLPSRDRTRGCVRRNKALEWSKSPFGRELDLQPASLLKDSCSWDETRT